MADWLQSGAKAAATGATLGTAFGGPGAGTAIGAGLGFLGGALMAPGQSEYEAYTEEQLAELKRRQELGLLGLTSEEEAVMRARFEGQISAARREQQEELQRTAVGQDPGAFMKQAAAAEGEVAKQAVASEAMIAEADLAKRQQEESEIYELLAVQYDIQAQKEAEMWGAVADSAAGIAQASLAAGAAQADRENTMAMLSMKYGAEPGDIEDIFKLIGSE